ncbi:MAG: hypothetical protein QG577_1566, partial [Thermodesulfobacteriota bacterium]|nr:hypothetical protein [Thermodesulfobacteriota bacterium]
MTEIRRRKYFGFVWPSRYMESSVVNMACNSTSNLIFDLSHEDVIPLAERLREIGAPRDTVDLLMLPADIGPRRLDSLATDSITNRIWVDMSAGLGTEEIDRIAGISKSYQAHLSFIPIVCSIKSIFHILKHCPELQHIALKGNEAAGFVGSETSLSLLSTVKNHLSVHPGETSVYLWGGIGTPEAAAAVLGFGVSGIVFESLHWLTDLTNLDVELGKKIMKLRPDYTEILGSNLQVSVRLFNKGNSKAVRDLKAVGQGLCSREVSEEKRRQFIHEVSCRLVQPLESNLSTDQIIPLGIEASFCGSFVKQFGQGTGDAIKGFVNAAYQCLHNALEKPDRLKNSPAIAELGTRYAVVQGAMSWITDEPDFAAKVAQAGALPTIALGVLSPQDLEQKLGSLADVMAEMPYAVNVITLDENPYRASHFEWIMKTKPNFVVIAAGDPSHASRFLQQGIEVIYVSPTEELLRLAFNAGVKFVVCEGNEAGGHVGPYSTLTLAQRVLELRRSEPDLFRGRMVILAGGIFDRDTAFCATVLGADAVQVGTAYLATEEIVTTGALSKVYQKEILRARPGDTVVTGEVVGLRVRSLGTPKIESLCELERQFYAGTSDEASFRREVEALTAGSLYTAAKARNVSCGTGLDDEVCASQGQFMSGSSAGLIQVVTNLEALHRELVAGPSTLDTNFLDSHRDMVPTQEDSEQSRPSCLSLNEGKVRMAGKGAPKTEPIVITAMSLVNSLGDNCNEMLSASLAKKSGIVAVPISRWDHSIYYDPRPRVREKTYCNVGAFLDLHISRKELGIAPHDFRTMTGATKITMLLAHRVIEESGILDSDIPRDRISVLISQNSGEAAGTLPDMIIRGSTDKIVQAAKRVLKLEPEQERELENEIKKGRLGIDDTTLLGRLNCSAGGFICNKYGFMGPSFSVSAACATSLVALYTAVQLIHNGIIDAAVVGGGEEYLSPLHFMEFSALGALAGLSGAKRSPRETSRPFEIGRDGMVLGEGGGMLVVERESVA